MNVYQFNCHLSYRYYYPVQNEDTDKLGNVESSVRSGGEVQIKITTNTIFKPSHPFCAQDRKLSINQKHKPVPPVVSSH